VAKLGVCIAVLAAGLGCRRSLSATYPHAAGDDATLARSFNDVVERAMAEQRDALAAESRDGPPVVYPVPSLDTFNLTPTGLRI
jgi:hypothetical protein